MLQKSLMVHMKSKPLPNNLTHLKIILLLLHVVTRNTKLSNKQTVNHVILLTQYLRMLCSNFMRCDAVGASVINGTK